jgi:hypothetical protein
MKERDAVLRGLKVFNEGSFYTRLTAVRDAYAYCCADCLANGREDVAREYSQIFKYCTKVIEAYIKRWEAINIPKKRKEEV